MKKLILFFILAATIVSCSDKATPKMKTEEFGLYQIDIPSSMVKDDMRELPSFVNWSDNDGCFLVIRYSAELSENDLYNDFYEMVSQYRENGYSVSIITEEDSVASMKISKGMFMSKSSYVLTNKFGKCFLVEYSGMGCDLDATKKIASSITQRKKRTTESIKLSRFENELYSIEYPKEWKYMTNLDENTDVYIGENNGMIGFSIMHFEIDESLEYVAEVAEQNWREYFGNTIKQTKTQIAGETAYIIDAKGDIQGIQIHNISYMLIHKGVCYNIRFGNDPDNVVANRDLIDSIMNSFTFKN